MLNVLTAWCGENRTTVYSKNKVVHYRPASIPRTNYDFSCCSSKIETVDKYVYLGLTIHEHLDWNVTPKVFAQSANRALGLLIAKSKSLGGIPYRVFTKLYDSMVWSVVAYGASVWGTRQFSCIDAVQFKAQRYILGTGKCIPTDAVAGDMGWTPTFIRQYKCICNHWVRYASMSENRVNKRIFNYCKTKSGTRCQNWTYRV